MEEKHNLQWKVAAQWILIVQEVVNALWFLVPRSRRKKGWRKFVLFSRRLTRGKSRRGIGGGRFFGRHILGWRGIG
jgi:hypothetical protein